MANLNVLISSAGRRVSLLHAFREAQAMAGVQGKVFAADLSSTSAAFHAADQGFLVPRCKSPEFIPTVLDLCKKNNIGLVIPTIDTELAAYAEHREAFAAIGTLVNISSPDTIAVGNDKRTTYRWLTESKLPTVKQADVGEVLANPEAWRFPLLVKPAGGSSSIGVAKVKSLDELRFATRDDDYIVQTIASGIEHTVDAFVDQQGKCVCAVPRRRIEVRAGEVSKAVAVKRSDILNLTKQAMAALPGAFGVLNMQVFVLPEDEPSEQKFNIIEINARFGGGYPLAWAAGAHYPTWLVQMALGQAPSFHENWQDGLTMLRYDEAVFVSAEKAGVNTQK